jgi:hypothetical protein
VIRQTAAGVEIDVRVIPRASRTTLSGTRDDALLVRLAAPPVEDAANEALIEFLADLLDVPQRSVRIISGARRRLKRVAVDGVEEIPVRTRLGLD